MRKTMRLTKLHMCWPTHSSNTIDQQPVQAIQELKSCDPVDSVYHFWSISISPFRPPTNRRISVRACDRYIIQEPCGCHCNRATGTSHGRELDRGIDGLWWSACTAGIPEADFLITELKQSLLHFCYLRMTALVIEGSNSLRICEDWIIDRITIAMPWDRGSICCCYPGISLQCW